MFYYIYIYIILYILRFHQLKLTFNNSTQTYILFPISDYTLYTYIRVHIAGLQVTFYFFSPGLNLPLLKRTQIIADPIYLAPRGVPLTRRFREALKQAVTLRSIGWTVLQQPFNGRVQSVTWLSTENANIFFIRPLSRTDPLDDLTNSLQQVTSSQRRELRTYGLTTDYQHRVRWYVFSRELFSHTNIVRNNILIRIHALRFFPLRRMKINRYDNVLET